MGCDDIQEPVCVVAINKGTGYVVTCTSCDGKDANKYAKYYRNQGYRSQILTYEVFDKWLEQEAKERRKNNAEITEMVGTVV